MTQQQHEQELTKDILKASKAIGATNNPNKIEALQKLIVILESWRDDYRRTSN